MKNTYRVWIALGPVVLIGSISERLLIGSNYLLFFIQGLFYLLIPGLLLTHLFFPHHDSMINAQAVDPRKRSLDYIERFTLATLLSVVVTTVMVYALFLIGGLQWLSLGRFFTTALIISGFLYWATLVRIKKILP